MGLSYIIIPYLKRIWGVLKDIVSEIAGQKNLLIEMEHKAQVRVDGWYVSYMDLHSNYN